MLLTDLGASVLRIDRMAPSGLSVAMPLRFDLLQHGRDTVAIDLKRREGTELALHLVGQADALIEGFRPGTVERLRLGPDAAIACNPHLVYGRMTGFGQTAGPERAMNGALCWRAPMRVSRAC